MVKKHSEECKLKISKALKGNNHPKAKDKDYYSKNAVFRGHFKRTCLRMGWNFEDFEEVLAPKELWRPKRYGSYDRKYYYNVIK